MTRVVSLGLDGAAWHKLDRLMAEGSLPNLRELTNGGVRAPLRTVTPPVTCPAWRCSTAGKNPGKLGVYWWLDLDHGTGAISSPDADSFATADVWNYLSDDGYRCAVLNVPMTFPPSELDGTMVSGFGASFDAEENPDESITYPPEFEQDLRETYDWRTHVADVTTEEGLDLAYDVIRSRLDLLCDLVERDYEYVHLTVFYVNALQHKYGDGEETKRAWELIDESLGRLDTEDTLLVVYSDHGHQAIEHTFVVNQWLIENGYLSLTSDSSDAVSKELYTALSAHGISPKRLAVLARRLLPTAVHDRLLPSSYPISSAELAQRVDWAETDAVAFSQGPLYLNRTRLGGRYESVRDSLRRELEGLTHRGEEVLSSVRTAEETYHGPHVDEAPDLVLSSDDGWEIYGGIVPSTFESQVMSWTSGNHPVGMLLLNGPGVEPGELAERSILDVAPTVLSYLDSPVPRDMDGTVLEVAFPNRELPIREREPIEVSSTGKRSDDDEFRRELEELGYLE